MTSFFTQIFLLTAKMLLILIEIEISFLSESRRLQFQLKIVAQLTTQGTVPTLVIKGKYFDFFDMLADLPKCRNRIQLNFSF